MTADTLHTLTRIVHLHGDCCARAMRAITRFHLKSHDHHSRRAIQLAALHHRILVAMLPHSELAQLLRRVS